MSTDHWMPLYVGDYLADTGHLSACEHGAYLLLLMHYWRNGPLPDNDKQLAAIARTDRKVWTCEVGPVIREFFVAKDGKLHQKRCDAERTRAEEVSAKRRAAAESRWKGNQTPPDKPNGPISPDAIASANAPPKAGASDGPMHVQLQPQSQVHPRKEESSEIFELDSSKGNGGRAREEPRPNGLDQTLRDAGVPMPKPGNAWINPNEPKDCAEEVLPPDQVGAGATMAQIRRVARAHRNLAIPQEVKRSPTMQIEAMEAPSPIAECDGYRWAPAAPVRTPAQQLAEILGIPLAEAEQRFPAEARQ